MQGRQSWKALRDQRRKENFVGRQEQLRVFSENFIGEVPNYMVFSVTGEGGVGKSTLLQQFANIATATNIKAMAVTCDDKHPSPASTMGHIASELAKLDIKHKDFDERYKKYRELREEIESDPKAPHGAIDLVARGVTDLVIKSGRKIPGVGVFLEGADPKVAGETLAQLINYGITRWGNKDEVLLLRDTERVLTPLFLELLAKAYAKHGLVLMFDVFEHTAPSLAPWLLALFNFEYGEFDTNLTFVISGRDPLEQHWTELVGTICHIALEPFTPDETRLYLSNQSIYDDELIQQIHEDTGGLPVLVELLAATKPQPGMPLPDVSKDAVERFLQWIPQEERRRVALLAAVPRQFNRDLLNATLGSDAANTFAWLSTQSFVRVNAERGWFYHEKVRELMLRYLRHTTPNDLEEAHTRLADFFAHEQAKLNLEGETAYDSAAWRTLECERVYHIVSTQPDIHRHEAINAFFHAFRWHWGFAEDIARTLQQLGHERGTQTIRDWASRLLDTYKAYDQEEYLLGVEQLASFETQNGLTAVSCCEIHALRGYMSAQAGKGEQALADLHRAIELDEQYAWALGSRGQTYQQMGKYEEALADLTRAIELDTEDAGAVASCGVIHGQMGKYEEALADLTRAIELDEKYAWATARRGMTYRQMGKYEEALADLTRAIELNEQYAWAIVWRGETYQQMGKYEEALTDFTHAIELNDRDAWALGNRGETYQQMGKYEEALADFTRAIELDGNYVWAITYRGETHKQMGKYEEAPADFTRAIELNEQSAWAIAWRGETYWQMDKYEEALADFTRAIELDGDYVWAITYRGETYQQMGKYEEALADFTRAIELDKQSAGALESRGETYQQMGKYEEALADLAYAIELNNKDVWAIAWRGKTYQQMGKHEEALTDLTHAIELDEKLAWAVSCRGETYRRMAQYEEAIVDFSKVADLGEADAYDFSRRAAAYLELGNAAVAQTDLSRAMELPLEDAYDFYSRAIALVLSKKCDEAIEMLIQAFEHDVAAWILAETDDLLDPIRNLPRFQSLRDSTIPPWRK